MLLCTSPPRRRSSASHSKADWDASSDDGSTKPDKLVTATAPKKKGTLKAKLAQKEAERIAREEAGTSIADEFVEDEATKKARLRAAEIEADLGNAASLLGGSSVDGDYDGTAPEQVLKLLTASPKTKDDFARLGQQVYDLLLKQHSHKPLYAAFVELFTRELCVELRDVETRKVASGLTALASEKTKEAKEKASGKGKKKVAGKPALGVGKPGAK